MGESWEAVELLEDGGLDSARYSFEASDRGWRIRRDGAPAFEIGSGYRMLKTRSCGVCATDLARLHLPFPLPQVIGHEVLAEDEDGRRFVIDINASCAARQLAELCDRCRDGLPSHCRERLTLGINQLPGGFGEHVLAPVGSVLEVPDTLADDSAVLMEPFAAALHAVDTVDVSNSRVVAVFGPRRLGMLAIAALRARRAEAGHDFLVRAVVRREAMGALALTLGADAFSLTGRDPLPLADVVIETSGNPGALNDAIACAEKELHLKSTHGRGAAGLEELTGFVVDELRLVPCPTGGGGDAPRLLDLEAAGAVPDGRLQQIRIGSAVEFDRAVRPGAGETSWLAPRGTIMLEGRAPLGSPLLEAVQERGLRVTSSRCGNFQEALALMSRDDSLRQLGRMMVTHRYKRSQLAAAFAMAASPESVKVVVD